MPVNAIITDIEGTTTDIQFVHKVLFPYAAKALPNFIIKHQQKEHIAAIITQVKELIENQHASTDEVIDTLLQWIKTDKKITALKTLQGYIWKAGYEMGDFSGHVYADASYWLKQWHEMGLPLYVYSSGSEQAQRLLYQYSDKGDLSTLFSGYFDTRVGAKKDADSYRAICRTIKVSPEEVLFLSDIKEELDAATAAGLQTVLLARDDKPASNYPYATQFAEVNPLIHDATSQLCIYHENNPETPLFSSQAAALISKELSNIGVQFRRWPATRELALNADNETILESYNQEIKSLVKQEGYSSVDVVNINPNNPNKATMRQKFLNEHTHSDDEVRFFVRGAGLFYLHTEKKVYVVYCQRNDLINVPAKMKHWFDMGENPSFTCIRLFNDPKGWEADYTGDPLASRFPHLMS